MAKGGARTRSGPPPDPNALARERDAGEWVELPAGGRPGEVPGWPLYPDASERESAVWADEWSKPWALMWEREGMDRLAALYVRRMVEAEQPGSPVALSTLVRQLADELGVSPSGRLRNRWKIVTGDQAQDEQPAQTSSARDRFRVVSG